MFVKGGFDGDFVTQSAVYDFFSYTYDWKMFYLRKAYD